MRQVWRGFNCRRQSGALVFEGHLQPLDVSRRYRVRVRYHLGAPPRVWVLDPPLRCRPDQEEIPHTYSEDGPRPCLFFPDGRQWDGSLPLAVTVLPWLLEWLVFYEIWWLTGSWVGGGVGHGGES